MTQACLSSARRLCVRGQSKVCRPLVEGRYLVVIDAARLSAITGANMGRKL